MERGFWNTCIRCYMATPSHPAAFPMRLLVDHINEYGLFTLGNIHIVSWNNL